MLVLRMNYCYIFWPRKANTRRATWTLSSIYLNMILACAPVLPVTAIYKNSLYIILACVAKCWSDAWIIGIFLARKDEQKNSYMDSLLFYPNLILACASVLPVTAMYKKTLYMILACVAKCRSSAWITGILLATKGQHKNSYMDYAFLPLYAF